MDKIPQPTVETSSFKCSILISKDGYFKVRIRDKVRSDKFLYYDQAYHYLSKELKNFFVVYTEKIKEKQNEILK